MLKAELHCHIEGAADPALVMRLAGKYGIDLNDVIRDGRYLWHDFASFLACYDKSSAVFRSPQDYRLLTYDYFARLAAQDTIYAEVFASPDHAAPMGIGYQDLVGAMAAGIEDAHAEFGIEGRILVTCVRHLGPEAAENVADQLCRYPHPMVTGFGMAGDENAFDVADFANAFEIAADAGVGLTAHAGEFAGPESVRAVLDLLGVSRIGHGVRAIEDAALVSRLASENIVLEVCAGSNIALSVYSSYESHPLRLLAHAGVPVTLNSDDPPFFDTSLSKEYETARENFGFSNAMLALCTRTAIEAAFIDEQTRERLLKRLDKSA